MNEADTGSNSNSGSEHLALIKTSPPPNIASLSHSLYSFLPQHPSLHTSSSLCHVSCVRVCMCGSQCWGIWSVWLLCGIWGFFYVWVLEGPCVRPPTILGERYRALAENELSVHFKTALCCYNSLQTLCCRSCLNFLAFKCLCLVVSVMFILFKCMECVYELYGMYWFKSDEGCRWKFFELVCFLRWIRSLYPASGPAFLCRERNCFFWRKQMDNLLNVGIMTSLCGLEFWKTFNAI